MVDVTQPKPFNLEEYLNPSSGSRKVTGSLDGGQIVSATPEEGDKHIFRQADSRLGKQDFLNLLVTQLKYQDPLNPTENTEFVAQLAQFSSLEGTQNINDSVEKLSAKLEGMVTNQKESAAILSNSSATSLIGKRVRVEAGAVDFKQTYTEPVKINVNVTSGADSVLAIMDEEENIINAINLNGQGEQVVHWDGRRLDGTKAQDGRYTIKVATRDGLQNTGYTYLDNIVNGIKYGKEGMRLEVGDQEIPLSDVIRVGGPEQNEEG